MTRRSLFDLPLGHSAIWTITEEEVETKATDGREEVVTAVLPAWSAETTVDLDHEDLGLPPRRRVIKKALRLPELTYEGKQAAIARYGAVGFEAAAVSACRTHVVGAPAPPGLSAEATLRFGHPFAVVGRSGQRRPRSPAVGPCVEPLERAAVFSAWVSEPAEAEPAAG